MKSEQIFRCRRLSPLLATIVPLLFLAAGCSTNKAADQTANQQSGWTPSTQAASSGGSGQNLGLPFEQHSPYQGYLAAHNRIKNPLEVLGGPTIVTISQTNGAVHVALPDYRQLDPDVFGTVAMPLAYGGAPVAEGIPLQMRESAGDNYTRLNRKTPFGQANTVMHHGKLNITLTDATATDAANSKDKVKFDARWQDADGNVYEVRCHEVLPHGALKGHPTFGGVVLNHLMHGSSRIGTPLEPTLFCYAAFWGTGDVLKNGKIEDAGRLVHGMLTESVRGKNYQLDFDHQVDPTNLVFHLIVPPMRNGKPDAVTTGFTLKNGKPLPFWHVMFNHFTVTATHHNLKTTFARPEQ